MLNKEKQELNKERSIVEDLHQEVRTLRESLKQKKDIVRIVQDEKRTLEASLEKSYRSRERAAANYHAVRSSLSYRLGATLVNAVSRPGLNTLLLPWQLLKLFLDGVKRLFMSPKQKERVMASQQLSSSPQPEVKVEDSSDLEVLRQAVDKRIAKHGIAATEDWLKERTKTDESNKNLYREAFFYAVLEKDANFALNYLTEIFKYKMEIHKEGIVPRGIVSWYNEIIRDYPSYIDLILDSSIAAKLPNRNRLFYRICLDTLKFLVKIKGFQKTKEWIDSKINLYPDHEYVFCRSFFFAFVKKEPKICLEYGKRALHLNQDDQGMVTGLITAYRRLGDINFSVELFEQSDKRSSLQKLIPFFRSQHQLLKKGFCPELPNLGDPYTAEEKRIFYVLYNSLPYVSGGYATRTHGLLSSLKPLGWDIYGVTRLGFPTDLGMLGIKSAPELDMVDGITYLHLFSEDCKYGRVPLTQYLQKYAEELMHKALEYRPAIIHSASNYVNGVVSIKVAQNLNIPSIYEVRGLWEITRLSRQPEFAESDFYKMFRRLEIDSCQGASAVIAITKGLKRELIERGVPEEKITLVPNGVDTDRFTPRSRDKDLETRLGFQNKKVVGYVGSFVQYEGLDYLLRAAGILKANGRDDFRVLLVGDGAVYDELREMCEDLQLNDIVTFTGRVPHEEVESYYSLLDIAPFPRKGLPVCEMVSPLKPFEAMAMKKVVVASDVSALAEIVSDGKTGLLHKKDDVDHLAQVLETLLDNSEFRQRLAGAGRKRVIAERDWKVLSRMVSDLYEELGCDHQVN